MKTPSLLRVPLVGRDTWVSTPCNNQQGEAVTALPALSVLYCTVLYCADLIVKMEMQTLGTFLFKSLSYCAYRDDVPLSEQ